MFRLAIPLLLGSAASITAGGLTSIPLATSVNSAAFAREWAPVAPLAPVGLHRPGLTWRPSPVWEVERPAARTERSVPKRLLAKAQAPPSRPLPETQSPRLQFTSVEPSTIGSIIQADFYAFDKKTSGKLVDAQVKVRRKRRGAGVLPAEGARRFTVHARLESKSGARITFPNGTQQIDIPNVQFDQSIQIPTMAANQAGAWRLVLEVKEQWVEGSAEKSISTQKLPFLKKAMIASAVTAVAVLPLWYATQDPTRTTLGLGPGRVSIP